LAFTIGRNADVQPWHNRAVEQSTSRTATASATGLLAVGAVAAIVYAVLSLEAARQGVFDLDRSTDALLAVARHLGLRHSMQAISLLGQASALAPLIIGISLLLWRDRRRWAFALPAVMAGTGALQFVAKWAVNRPRPNGTAWGFPSGHVLSLVVFLGLLVYLLMSSGLGRTWRWVGCGISAGVLLAVAFSRLYLDMHWLSDVFGGFALGLAYLLAIIWGVEHIAHRRQRQGLSVPAGRDGVSNDRTLSSRARISSLT